MATQNQLIRNDSSGKLWYVSRHEVLWLTNNVSSGSQQIFKDSNIHDHCRILGCRRDGSSWTKQGRECVISGQSSPGKLKESIRQCCLLLGYWVRSSRSCDQKLEVALPRLGVAFLTAYRLLPMCYSTSSPHPKLVKRMSYQDLSRSVEGLQVLLVRTQVSSAIAQNDQWLHQALAQRYEHRLWKGEVIVPERWWGICQKVVVYGHHSAGSSEFKSLLS